MNKKQSSNLYSSSAGKDSIFQKKKKQTFITRADFMASKDFPKSNSMRIIIPSNSSGNGFLKHQYIHEYLNQYISKDEFDEIVESFSSIVIKLHSMKRKYDNLQLAKSVKLIFLLAMILGILFCIVFYQGSIQNSSQMIYTGFIFLIISCAVVLLLYFTLIIMKRKQPPVFEDQVKEQLDKFFNQINKRYIERGLFWRCVQGHYWVELRIDKHLKDDQKKLELLKTEKSLASLVYHDQLQIQAKQLAQQYKRSVQVKPFPNDDLNPRRFNGKITPYLPKHDWNKQTNETTPFETQEKFLPTENELSYQDGYIDKNLLKSKDQASIESQSQGTAMISDFLLKNQLAIKSKKSTDKINEEMKQLEDEIIQEEDSKHSQHSQSEKLTSRNEPMSKIYFTFHENENNPMPSGSPSKFNRSTPQI